MDKHKIAIALVAIAIGGVVTYKYTRKPVWLGADVDVTSAEIEAIVWRADGGGIDWDSSRHLYWHKNPLKLAWWVFENGKEGKRSLQKRKQLLEGG